MKNMEKALTCYGCLLLYLGKKNVHFYVYKVDNVFTMIALFLIQIQCFE